MLLRTSEFYHLLVRTLQTRCSEQGLSIRFFGMFTMLKAPIKTFFIMMTISSKQDDILVHVSPTKG